ncbi:peptide-methionine (S)-S-oxide reductase MsrA [Paenibacillus sp. JX-17]|uniref:Peptide methionine sulfoxide reductase MsrA n=1 Tax=Paenibacillus lacisoli TaxID=3064525 RepID=A0ABT9CH06_9BACL|nr:peptide-methionine (S)-S-oxide reductase MsrA [Paenibacillus sp. JX-17]MDO7908185.1 peptide-methionine (S)-S-oxide reductase MsrA [Paenibacillus sp. JX-17]
MNTEDHAVLQPKLAVFGMGCFWGPEARFGALPGVIGTKTGYAGGTAPAPRYRCLGDHSECVRVEYDPQRLSYEELLELFWNHHQPAVINNYKGRQYRSLILCFDEEQRCTAMEAARRHHSGTDRSATEIAMLTEFYPAEERHQKYYLQRRPEYLRKLQSVVPPSCDWWDNTLAARLNAAARGHIEFPAYGPDSVFISS